MSADECPGCGSTPKDRADYAARNADDSIPLELATCPRCDSQKCCMCDMGDDVECLSCGNDD